MTAMIAAKPALFLDRDGVINDDIGYLYERDKFVFLPGVLETAKIMSDAGYALIVVTNQSGIARGMYTEAQFMALNDWMCEQFAKAGAPLTAVYFCPHHPAFRPDNQPECSCRKPAPGMLIQAASEHHLDLTKSIMVGDKEDDMKAAYAAGIQKRYLVATGMQEKTLALRVMDGLKDLPGVLVAS